MLKYIVCVAAAPILFSTLALAANPHAGGATGQPNCSCQSTPLTSWQCQRGARMRLQSNWQCRDALCRHTAVEFKESQKRLAVRRSLLPADAASEPVRWRRSLPTRGQDCPGKIDAIGLTPEASPSPVAKRWERVAEGRVRALPVYLHSGEEDFCSKMNLTY